MLVYLAIFVLLFVLELGYFRIADRFNIIDKPNLRSSHTRSVLRGGGIIFTIALWIWSIWSGFEYPWLLAGVTLAAGISFIDDIHSLPDSVRLVVQIASLLLVFQEVGMLQWDMWWLIPIALIVALGGTNIFNFMDGINGITGGYSLAIIIPLMILNEKFLDEPSGIAERGMRNEGFVDSSLLIVIGLSALVFCFFNFRTRAKCFAGDVGSIGMALILVFCIGRLMVKTGDVSWIVLYLLYGVDGMMTIGHRIMLHENLGQAHRKHAFQLMSNELKMPHVVVSSIYMVLQLVISLVAIFVIPDTPVAHWAYLIGMAVVMGISYIVFMMKFYHLHESYIRSISFQKETEPKENSTLTKPSPTSGKA